MSAYIFLCDMSTEKECIDRRLFGTNPGDAHRYHYSKIAVGDMLFLYNFETGFLRGPFKAVTTCKSNIDPAAWKKTRRSFPWQVRVDVEAESKRWLDINDVSRIVTVTTGKIGLLPPYELTDEQAEKLITAFRLKAGTPA